MNLNPLDELKKEIFRSEKFQQKNMAQMIDEVKEIQHQLMVYKERATEMEKEIEIMKSLAYKIRFSTAR